MQLHDPYATATPSQRLAAVARNMRLAKIAGRAVVDRPIDLHAPKFVEPPPEIYPAVPNESWAERQKKIPLPKPHWFEIIAEIGPIEPIRPTVEQIQRASCDHFDLTRTDFLSERRTAYIVLARQTAMYLCKVLTLRTLPEIGRRFVGRDHTTVLHAVRKIAAKVASDPVFSAEVDLLKIKIGEQAA